MANQQYAHEDYTIGWICALSQTEAVAAAAMLDDEHPSLPAADLQDVNTYRLGRIGAHNVVIGCLPARTEGKVSAATVVTHMIRSFPAMRFGLMVGIGGGVPYYPRQREDTDGGTKVGNSSDSEDEVEDVPDIRLGDVVVSLHTKTTEAVVQYDFGKSLQEKGFVHAGGKLNKPPNTVLNAVSTLQTNHARGHYQVPELLSKMLAKNPRMANFQHPGSRKDRLFRADFLHVESQKSCKACCGLDNANLVKRTDRADTVPKIHYGTIGSADRVMKNAILRDQWAIEENIICFEMEAAGLMDSFPGLVIRGICDYADSHKNKIWQPYAAATAAAYAKELLLSIPALDVTKLCSIKQYIHNGVKKIERDITALTQRQHDEEKQNILDWLTPTDYSSQHNDIIKSREPGTGQWLLESDEFRGWVHRLDRTLFCPGIPGAGKTIITSTVVDFLRETFQNNDSVGIAYFYCNFRQQEELHPINLFLSLLKQLAQGCHVLPESLERLHQKHKPKRSRPTLSEILKTLELIVVSFSHTFIIVDALDECKAAEGIRSKVLSEIFNLQAKTRASLFATSRFIPEIEKEFKRRSAIILEVRATDDDVRRYLDANASRLPSFVREKPGLEETLKATIISAIDGMFLLAKLHLNSLESKITLNQIEDALKTLPKGVDGYRQAYEEAMERVYNQQPVFRDLALRALTWICCARRPLTPQELQHALAIVDGSSALNEGDITEVGLIASACAGLVVVDEKAHHIRLVHYTTQEYFQQTWIVWFPNAHMQIARTCITYMAFSTFESGFCPSNHAFEERLRLYPLYSYIARNWGYHVRAAPVEVEQLVGLLENENKVSACSQALLTTRSYNGYGHLVTRHINGMHLAAYWGLEKVMAVLCDKGHDPNLEDSKGRTPLSWAAENGHETLVKLLLDQKKVMPDSEDDSGRTPLSWAADKGHRGVAELLLNSHRVKWDSKDSYGQTPLSWAAEQGHETVVKLFLGEDGGDPNLGSNGLTLLSWAAKKGRAIAAALFFNQYRVDPGSEDRGGRTPLSWAAGNGHEKVVKLLLNDGRARPDSKDDHGRTPLSWAARHGRETVLKLLLDDDKVQPDSKDMNERTPLSWAAESGDETVVKLLLDEDCVNPDSKDSLCGQTPLSWAAEKGHETVVELLLATEAVDPDSKASNGRTPLSWASWNGCGRVVKLLLNHSTVDPNSKDNDGRTPLSWAARYGQETVVRLFLSKDTVDLNSKDKSGRTALSWAAEKGQKAVVKLLLNHNRADPDSKDNDGRTPFSWAAGYGQETVVRLFLTQDAIDVNSKDNNGRTPFSWAAGYGQEAIVKLLLNYSRIDPESKDNNGRTPFSWAAGYGQETMVRLFLSKDAIDLNSKDKYGRTPLSWAAGKGQEAVVKLLLNHSRIDPDLKDNNGRTPFSWAAGYGQETVVRLFFSKDAIDLNSKDNNGQTPFSWAVGNGQEIVVWLFLSEDAIELNSKDNNGRTPLSVAAGNGYTRLVWRLLDEGGVDPNSEDIDGRTPLSWAAGYGHEAVVKLFLAKDRVDLDSTDRDKWTPLSWATYNRHEAVISEAVAALSETSTSTQIIFIEEGTYEEQVYIPSLAGELIIYGQTEDTSSYSSNLVTLTYGLSASDAGSDDLSATLRNYAENSKIYNINVENSYGSGSQALALSAYATDQGYYACQFIGYQDTVLAETGNQVYAKSYIEGATDFIFGQHATAWFDDCDIGVLAKSDGTITANGRSSSSDASYYVINNSNIAAASGQSVSSGSYYLGRPWSEYARVVFQYTAMSDVINSAGWEEWSSSEPNTEDILFGEYDNSGDGSEGTRASFATKLSAPIDITTILGDDYADWVDTTYLS